MLILDKTDLNIFAIGLRQLNIDWSISITIKTNGGLVNICKMSQTDKNRLHGPFLLRNDYHKN